MWVAGDMAVRRFQGGKPVAAFALSGAAQAVGIAPDGALFAAMDDRVDLDALYIWSTVHGLAGVLNGNCIDKLNLKRKVLEQAIEHAIVMVELGLSHSPMQADR